ncbi:S1C family serine protease [Candidatus Sororendozoicomonas aggregata]|uniref:S1C family serine protease n=1 Tax=Candidatus Sororendozoicomonas aggregata TaxID=3073239 RepID=UPI002ED6494E
MKKQLQFFGWPVLAGVIVCVVIFLLKPGLMGFSSESLDNALNRASTWFSPSSRVSYSSGVKRATPAVVNISTASAPQRKEAPIAVPPHMQGSQKVETSLGSGVIVSPDGFILTNNHVIQGAERIIVSLRDGREEIATVVGTDPETDLAVLRVNTHSMPYIHLADSSQAEIGDVVLAIGNPFGLGQTVTMGIISATGRNDLQLNTYEDFIQTDAAINIGNSGGALINAYGDLIGISTLLFSRGGGNEGVGFAIPSNMARFVMRSIIRYGVVIRGWLGIESQPLSNTLAGAYGIKPDAGILISGVYNGGPADRAGIQRGDILTKINGQSTSDGRRVMNMVAQKPPGSHVTIEIIRNGQVMDMNTEVDRRPNIVSN